MAKPKSNNSHSKAPSRKTTATAKSAAAAKKKLENQIGNRMIEADSEEDSDEDENLMRFSRKNGGGNDESEVFNLNMGASSDESEEDEDEVSESESGASDLGDDDDDLHAFVDKLAPELKAKILNKDVAESSEDEEEEEEESSGWGKKKAYYNGDTADLEIGQEFEDALDEEAAAREMFEERAKKISKSDLYDDMGDESSDEADSADDSEAETEMLRKRSSKRRGEDGVTRELEAIALAQDGMDLGDADVVEHLTKDISKMTKDQKLELVTAHSPELVGIVEELRERVEELQSRVTPVRTLVVRVKETGAQVDDDLVEYLEMKQQLLLAYCLNVSFYLYLKALGRSVRSHPVMRQLLRLRYAMEKLQSLDNKLKYQIDRLVKFAEQAATASNEELQAGLLRPNLSSFMLDGGEEEGTDASDASGGDDSDDGIYRPPKLTSVPYPSEADEDKTERKLAKHGKKLRTSELMATLRSEFGSAPEETGSAGLGEVSGVMKLLAEESAERTKYEEERFMRTTLTRKEKQSIKKREREANRLDNFEDIGDFGDLEELSKLSAARAAMDPSASLGKKSGKSDPFSQATSTKALQRAMMELGGGAAGFDSDDDAGSSKKRRPAPSMDDEDGDANVFDDFVDKKKKFKSAKEDHYTVAPRYGGFEDALGDDDKRAATYEIIKNRGLTPHRKKENRNPRVKKREKFEKAKIARKGQIREVVTGMAAAYAGETTGIKASTARSRKM